MARIVIVSPSLPGAATGNAVTAERWRTILRSLGHKVVIVPELGDARFDVLIALHATKSAASVRRALGRGRIVVALTGTDLYQDLSRLRTPWDSLERAGKIVVLQPLALQELPSRLRQKAVVIRQSATMPTRFETSASRSGRFNVIVLANLRPVKDPLRAAYAARLLPSDSRVRVVHGGGALQPAWAERARKEMQRNARYVWKGELSVSRARRLLAGGDLLVLSSRSEGGANVLSEAIVAGVPILASNIPGNIGILGRTYPGFFPVGDSRALSRLLRRAEADKAFYERLHGRVQNLASLFDPDQERRTWKELVQSVVLSSH